MVDLYTSQGVDLSAYVGNEDEIEQRCYELHMMHKEHMEKKLSKDAQKMKIKDVKERVVKVGLVDSSTLHHTTSELQLERANQWFGEEMRLRQAMKQKQEEQEALNEAEARELQEKENKLEELKSQWQAKAEEVLMEEGELVRIQKEFDEKLSLQLRARTEGASSSSSKGSEVATFRTRMQEEAHKRALKKELMQTDNKDAEERARLKLIQDIEDKAQLEREIMRAQKEVGLMRQRIRGREKSHMTNMIDERKRRVDNDEPRPQMTTEELYAPRKAAPRPVIPSARELRLEEARLAKEARRAQLAASGARN